MLQPIKSIRTILCAVLFSVVLLGDAFAQEGARVEPIPPGGQFPAGSYGNLNAGADGPSRIDLGQYLGRKPVILHYWIPFNTRSEETFTQLEELVREIGADRLVLLGVAVPRPGRDEKEIGQRLQSLGIKTPVLNDAGFEIGKRLLVRSVPNITIIDAKGKMRLSNGASLAQVLGYKVDLAQAIRRTAESGELLNYGYLDAYHPVRELEGQPCPDFKAPLVKTSVEQRWHSMLDDSKVNVLIFWSVNCQHCRKSLPEINDWLESNADGVNVVSCASADTDEVKSKTREFCQLNEFSFPTLIDESSEIGNLYKITSTPTIVIIGPDGVVDSAIVSGYADFGSKMEEKKKKLLGAGGSS
jgi:thiol-disulfide isomerase/thioredoxin